MVYCVAVGCTSNSASVPTFEESFHSFPNDPKHKKDWIAHIKRKNYKWQSSHCVCSRHFVETDFVVSHRLAAEMKFQGGKCQLLPQAIPTQNLGLEPPQTESKRPSTAVDKLQKRRVCFVWIDCLKVEYLIICIICDTDLVNKLILQMCTLHKYK